MPSPSKRTQRARRDAHSDAITVERDSSPSRPNKRRKTKIDQVPSEAADETESASLAADQSGPAPDDEDQIITCVTQHLQTPEQLIQASKDHANTIHESNKEGVKAYAKIAAQDWTFYITALVVNIGRTADFTLQRTEEDIEKDKRDENAVHIDLGPSKLISRSHATVFFDRQDEKWCLTVKGRNGLKVNGVAWKTGLTEALTSGDIIEIGGVEMMFVLPIELSKLRIDDVYLQRAGIMDNIKTELAETCASTKPARHPLPSHDASSPPAKASSLTSAQQQKPLAPAPLDYKRPGTPPSVRAAQMAAQHKTPRNDSGTLLMSANDFDLRLDENKHIKPQYSYAQMITQAILNTGDEKLNLAGIYSYIMDNYSYYRHQPASGWQNSIRHNLSLNKAFEKVARMTDEPGKGMKWQLVGDSRDDMIRQAFRGGRGGHRGSSNPSSPSQLNYVTHGPRDMARDSASARKRKVSPSGSPQPRSALRESHQTPIRGTRRPLPDETGFGADGSPLPRPKKANNANTILGSAENAPGSPTLTSSYLQEEGSYVTPAPLRVHPKLAPPSTAQRPSQHMPTSSPAPFWKYADIGSTPLKPAPFDLSPSKALGSLPQSSSPPLGANKSPAASPTRNPRSNTTSQNSPLGRPPDEDRLALEEPDEDRGFDLTKGFQSIGSYHAPVSHGKQVQRATNGEPNRDSNREPNTNGQGSINGHA